MEQQINKKDNEDAVEKSFSLPTIPSKSFTPKSSKDISLFEELLQSLSAELTNFNEFRDSVEQLVSDNTKIADARAKEFVSFYNTLNNKLEKLEETFKDEIDARTMLEAKAESAEKTLIIKSLQDELEEERAMLRVFTTKFEKNVNEILSNLTLKIDEMKTEESVINEQLEQFRNGLENEHTYIVAETKKSIETFSKDSKAVLEEVRKHSIDFLKQCSTVNGDLIKKIPYVKNKKENLIIIALSGCAILCMLANIFFLFR